MALCCFTVGAIYLPGSCTCFLELNMLTLLTMMRVSIVGQDCKQLCPNRWGWFSTLHRGTFPLCRQSKMWRNFWRRRRIPNTLCTLLRLETMPRWVGLAGCDDWSNDALKKLCPMSVLRCLSYRPWTQPWSKCARSHPMLPPCSSAVTQRKGKSSVWVPCPRLVFIDCVTRDL